MSQNFDEDDFLNFENSRRKRQQEALSKVRTYRGSAHSDFGWWQERPSLTSSEYSYLRPSGNDPAVPPQHVLRTLDKFESFLNWLETKSIGQEMTAYEKAQIALKLLDVTSSRDLSVSLETNALEMDVNLKGNCEYPVWTRVEGTGDEGNLRIEQVD